MSEKCKRFPIDLLLVLFLEMILIIQAPTSEKGENEIIDFRELNLIVYGESKLSLKPDQYKLEVNINNTHNLCVSHIAFLDKEFRVDESLTDYFKYSEYGKLFTEDLRIQVIFSNTDETNQKYVLFDENLKMFPNDELNLKVENELFQVKNLIFRLSCHGYTGYNCQFKIRNNEKTTTDFKTGFDVCKTVKDCLPVDSQCDTNNCKNGGKCFINYSDKSSYCVCPDGFSGTDCRFDECSFDEDELMFGDKSNFCRSSICERDENPCKNSGNCTKYGKRFYHCTCNKNKFTGKYCETECVNECPEDSYCVNDDDGEGPYCYPSLKYPAIEYKTFASPLIYLKQMSMSDILLNAFSVISIIFISIAVVRKTVFEQSGKPTLEINLRKNVPQILTVFINKKEELNIVLSAGERDLLACYKPEIIAEHVKQKLM